MEYTTLGNTGMTVSKIGLGCMSFGDEQAWMLDEEEGGELIERAIDLGINFFDTSNSYSVGDSERILGRAIDGYDHDELVIATKVRFASGAEYPNALGLSRKTVEQELRGSLDRLGIDAIDLYQIHRWDDATPINVTLSAFDDAIHRGDVRYAGASSMWAYQLAHALAASDLENRERFQTMQNHYNLVYREEEREMLPLCEKEGIGVIPWSPLARGYLARPHMTANTLRKDSDEYIDRFRASYVGGGGREINERVQELADRYDATMAQVALAWLLSKDVVTAPIVGVSRIEHLEEAVEALDLSLSARDVDYLEEPYEPVPVVGHQ
ncbi:aldo/keto reductase [Haladaptatus sp. R4]|uniref:aldo/keto reductase n=1 Tax=Haladaptatus sp. R4 TaxID=1679489 RepID=UPI0007B4DBB0|nr:aldo/keto reductase [Haladaptatus sp. R4]KZN22568.1 aldo/keto reductase [Haladaptatus sp. R4]